MQVISSSFFGLLFASALISPAESQITTDGSTNTIVTPTNNGVRIDNGDQRSCCLRHRVGGNLFHSFGEFSVPTGSEAFFNNASDIVNIFSRVTGGNISNIDGLIRANGAANLFLINPQGIIFGNNASLQIGGSFYSSTADSILFPDGEFSAVNTQKPLLTINAPIGLNFRDNPQPITNRSVNNGLEVKTGENISFIGGDINFQGGRIFAPGGNVELGGLSAAGQIAINADGSLSFPDGIERADVSLTNNASVNVRGDGGGFIKVNARNLILSEQSELFAGIAADSSLTSAQAGDITLNATDTIIVRQASTIANQVETTGVGNAD